MAKKKRSQRKRNLAYSQRQAAKQQLHTSKEQADATVEVSSEVAAPAIKAKPNQVMGSAQLAYLRHDLRKIAVLATTCIGLELLLWILLQHTSLGTKVFGG